MAQQAADLPGNLRNIVGAFQMVPDPMARYKQLLFFASKLEGMDDSLKTEENKVQVSLDGVFADCNQLYQHRQMVNFVKFRDV